MSDPDWEKVATRISINNFQTYRLRTPNGWMMLVVIDNNPALAEVTDPKHIWLNPEEFVEVKPAKKVKKRKRKKSGVAKIPAPT